MNDAVSAAFGGSGDEIVGHLPLGNRFRFHAESLVRAERSPLCVAIMTNAADDIESGGTVAELFADIPVVPGAAPALRLLGALHYLVLSGKAPTLSEYYPSVGGTRGPDGVWPAVLATLQESFAKVRERLYQTVQTNEPGRSTVLFPALLWLTERYKLPIRLLEIGASAGLNLFADRFCYIVGGVSLGDAASAVRFIEPWKVPPDLDLVETAKSLHIVERAGCDLAPLDIRDPKDRLTLLSYIWPDELERLARIRAAIDIASADPLEVVAQGAARWLSQILPTGRTGVLTVIWHSLFRQYVMADERQALDLTFRHAIGKGSSDGPVVWLSMEPGSGEIPSIELILKTQDGEENHLATCGDHGPPVYWR